MITTDDFDIYQNLLSLRNQGRDISTSDLVHRQLGYNYRMSEMQAALGLAQISRIDEILTLRNKAAAYYYDLLSQVEGVFLQPWNDGASWFVLTIRVAGELRDGVLRFLNDHGIQSKAYFGKPIHLQPYFQQKYGYSEGMFPIAERLSKEIIALPFFTSIAESQISEVVDTLKAGLEHARKTKV